MSVTTGIEWTDATWNPIRGCSPVSAGCKNCYASAVAKRFSGRDRNGRAQPYEGLMRIDGFGKATDTWNGVVRFIEKSLLDPLKWKKPRRIFVNSMSDLFHENLPDAEIDKVFAVMALCPQHAFQVLTKRPQRMLEYILSLPRSSRRAELFGGAVAVLIEQAAKKWKMPAWPLPNVWLGVSCENQSTADERIPLLLKTPAAVRFISAEPLLGPVDLLKTEFLKAIAKPGWQGEKRYPFEGLADEYRTKLLHMLDWVIVGGESGRGARPCDLAWIQEIVDQCEAAGVPCFVKQLGSMPVRKWFDRDDPNAGRALPLGDRKGGDPSEWPHKLIVRQFPEVHA